MLNADRISLVVEADAEKFRADMGKAAQAVQNFGAQAGAAAGKAEKDLTSMGDAATRTSAANEAAAARFLASLERQAATIGRSKASRCTPMVAPPTPGLHTSSANVGQSCLCQVDLEP